MGSTDRHLAGRPLGRPAGYPLRRELRSPARTTSRRPARRQAEVLALHGEWDIARSEQLRRAVRKALEHSPRVVIDLAGVTILDCTCLAALHRLLRQSPPDGHRLCLAAPSPLVHRVLQAAAYDDVFPIFADVPRALRERRVLIKPGGPDRERRRR